MKNMLKLSHSESCDFFYYIMLYDFRMGVENGIK